MYNIQVYISLVVFAFPQVHQETNNGSAELTKPSCRSKLWAVCFAVGADTILILLVLPALQIHGHYHHHHHHHRHHHTDHQHHHHSTLLAHRPAKPSSRCKPWTVVLCCGCGHLTNTTSTTSTTHSWPLPSSSSPSSSSHGSSASSPFYLTYPPSG